MQLSQRKGTPHSRQTFFRLHMQKIREILKYFGDFFCGDLFFVCRWRRLGPRRASDVPRGATCGRRMEWGQVATGGLEIMLCIAPGDGDRFHT